MVACMELQEPAMSMMVDSRFLAPSLEPVTL